MRSLRGLSTLSATASAVLLPYVLGELASRGANNFAKRRASQRLFFQSATRFLFAGLLASWNYIGLSRVFGD